MKGPGTFRKDAWSVQVDWLGFLPAAHLTAFNTYARESESKYFSYSVALNEAISLRDKGSKTESLQMAQLASDLCHRLAEDLNDMFSSMAKHCRVHGTTPSVAALDAECFCRPNARRLVLLDVVISWPLSSRHKRFLVKLSTLGKIVTRSCIDFRTAATNVAVVDSSWAAMDAAHYDLNTCLREMLVMWKCFLRALSPDDLLLFQMAAQVAHKLGEGHLHKSQIKTETLSAVEAVLKGKRLASRNLESEHATRHEILFCSDETALLNGLTCFIANAMVRGNPAVIWATESHRDKLSQELRRAGVDVDAAIRRGIYQASDFSEPPDAGRIIASLTGLREAAIKGGNQHPRVAVCGERAGRMWGEGETDAALLLEQSLNQLAKTHDLDILCLYPFPTGQRDENAVKTICEEHSVVSFDRNLGD